MRSGDARRVDPLTSPPDAEIRLPGSKSLTNRVLLVAALADGTSTLDGVLLADDTLAMVDCLRALGTAIEIDERGGRAVVHGTGARLAPGPVSLDARQAGTVARFLPPVVVACGGSFELDGDPQLRARPMGPMIDVLRQMGAQVVEPGEAGHLPVSVTAPAPTSGGTTVSLPGHVSSQFVSGLLLCGPLLPGGLRVVTETPPVSEPYLAMTIAVMSAFGAGVARPEPGVFVIPPARYEARRHRIEPDASAASYFFGAAAICRGRVRVPGLGTASLQGDLDFVDVLREMGAKVERDIGATSVVGTAVLHGIEADMSELSDTAQTLAAVAVFADSPTRVTGIGFTRAKETDRVGAVVRELRRCGIDADEESDGFLVRPGTPRPARIVTDGDHRMAMSFALLGLRIDGIEIDDPDCVSKTFPGFWDALEQLR